MIGTSDQSCWLAEACKILLLHILEPSLHGNCVRNHVRLLPRWHTTAYAQVFRCTCPLSSTTVASNRVELDIMLPIKKLLDPGADTKVSKPVYN